MSDTPSYMIVRIIHSPSDGSEFACFGPFELELAQSWMLSLYTARSIGERTTESQGNPGVLFKTYEVDRGYTAEIIYMVAPIESVDNMTRRQFVGKRPRRR